MVQSRIREIRKEKKLTLQEVAERAGTTAQTIGRLETGARTLSLKWVNRISQALGVDSACLLALPEKGDIDISGVIEASGDFREKFEGTISPRLFAQDPIAVRVKAGLGAFREGDILVFEKASSGLKHLLAKEALIRLKNRDYAFGLILEITAKGEITFSPAGAPGKVRERENFEFAAPLTALIRRFG